MRHGFAVQTVQIRMVLIRRLRDKALLLFDSLTMFIGKNWFTEFSTKICSNRNFAGSDLFHMFTQSIKFSTFHCHLVKGTNAWER